MPPAIYDGTGLDLPMRFPVRAGALTMLFDDGALRYISLGETELMRGVYFAVRDENWGTIPATMTFREKLVEDDHFRIVFERIHEERHIRFRWTGILEGSRDGVITMDLDGVTETTFQRNRIGWCILHGHKAAGVRAMIEHVDGTESEVRFPDKIQPDQPFFDVRVIRHEAAPGLWFRTEMTGEIFETEDQRNYTDASFKTYSTPQRLPKPVTLETGTPIRQTVTMSLVAAPEAVRGPQTPFPLLISGTPLEPSAETSLRVTVDSSHAHPIPLIGLNTILFEDPLSDREVMLLKALNLGYVRGEVWLTQPDAASRLTRAAEDANRIGVPLAIAAFFGDDAGTSVNALVTLLDTLRPQPELAPLTIYLSGGDNGNAAKLRLVKEGLARYGVPIGVGADRFNTLNNNRPPADVIDFLSYGASPQVHAVDHLTHLETLWGQTEQIDSARILSGGKPIHVGPVTFRGFPGWQPVPDDNALDPLPWYVDPRQMSLFGAGWTLGSIGALAAGGASMATYYATVGMTGVIAHDSGILPGSFGDLNGVYPMWHVFKWVGDFAGGEAIAVRLNDPLVGTALALRKGGKNRLLVASAADHPLTVEADLPGQTSVTVKVLDESTADPAMQAPEAFQSAAGTPRPLTDGVLQLELAPYAVACIEWNG